MDPLLAIGFLGLGYVTVGLIRVKRMARHAQEQLPVLTQQVALASAIMTVTALFEEHGDNLVPIGTVTKGDARTLVDYLAEHWHILDAEAVEDLRTTMPRA